MSERYVFNYINYHPKFYNIEYKDSWYDFDIWKLSSPIPKKLKIEVKSCKLNNGNAYGKFVVSDRFWKQCEAQDDVYLCFVIQTPIEFAIIGFVKAKDFKQKQKYITLSQLFKQKIEKFI